MRLFSAVRTTPMQAIFAISAPLPPHGMREKVVIERGLFRQKPVERENGRCGNQVVEPNLLRQYLCPVPVGQPMLGGMACRPWRF